MTKPNNTEIAKANNVTTEEVLKVNESVDFNTPHPLNIEDIVNTIEVLK